jgi:hypothetical protein
MNITLVVVILFSLTIMVTPAFAQFWEGDTSFDPNFTMRPNTSFDPQFTRPSNWGMFQVVIPVVTEDNIFGIRPDIVVHNWLGEMNFFIKEYPFKDGHSYCGDVHDAFWHDGPFTGLHVDMLEVPDSVIKMGETFHLCVENDGTPNIPPENLGCWEFKRTDNVQIVKILLADKN